MIVPDRPWLQADDAWDSLESCMYHESEEKEDLLDRNWHIFGCSESHECEDAPARRHSFSSSWSSTRFTSASWFLSCAASLRSWMSSESPSDTCSGFMSWLGSRETQASRAFAAQIFQASDRISVSPEGSATSYTPWAQAPLGVTKHSKPLQHGCDWESVSQSWRHMLGGCDKLTHTRYAIPDVQAEAKDAETKLMDLGIILCQRRCQWADEPGPRADEPWTSPDGLDREDSLDRCTR